MNMYVKETDLERGREGICREGREPYWLRVYGKSGASPQCKSSYGRDCRGMVVVS